LQEKKIIGIFGVRKHDFCIYLAGILNNLGSRVLVIDNSPEEEIRCCVPGSEGHISTVTYKNVDYEFGSFPKGEAYEKYQYILTDMGSGLKSEDMGIYDEIILVTDAYRRNIERYREALKLAACPVTVIIRNVCQYKATGRQLFGLLIEEPYRIVDRYYIQQDPEDEEYAVLAQYEPYREFGRISAGFKKALAGTAAGITGLGMNEIMRALKSAGKGRCI